MAALSETLTAAEETHWIALYNMDPWGDERADLRSAQISHILWNTNVKKENARKITEFLPFHRKPIKQDPDVDKSIRNVFQKLISRKEK